ncbi:MAG: ribosomal-protein-alanine N-acetyltransferase [Alteromonadaceae bacterium]|jgi:ribosomal-protein-alanine N-acetyltransferase
MFETRRFILKKLKLSNANSNYLNWFSDELTNKFILSHPTSISDLIAFIKKCNGDDSILLLGIFTKAPHCHIGNIKFEFENNVKTKATMGIIIGDSTWRGKGAASEVIHECGLFLKNKYDTETMILGVDKLNYSAIKSYRKIGFEEETNSNFNPMGLLMSWKLPKV